MVYTDLRDRALSLIALSGLGAGSLWVKWDNLERHIYTVMTLVIVGVSLKSGLGYWKNRVAFGGGDVVLLGLAGFWVDIQDVPAAFMGIGCLGLLWAWFFARNDNTERERIPLGAIIVVWVSALLLMKKVGHVL